MSRRYGGIGKRVAVEIPEHLHDKIMEEKARSGASIRLQVIKALERAIMDADAKKGRGQSEVVAPSPEKETIPDPDLAEEDVVPKKYPDDLWTYELIPNRSGDGLAPIELNLEIFARSHDDFKGTFGLYNGAVYVLKHQKWGPNVRGGYPRKLTDSDISHFRMAMERHIPSRMSISSCLRAIQQAARAIHIDPDDIKSKEIADD